jgi:hypothetical protein
MQEPPMIFDGVKLSPQKETVRIFFNELWDRPDPKSSTLTSRS